MTIITNTFATYEAKGNREDLIDAIYNITPTQTPFLSAIPKTNAKATRHEWQTDVLADPAANAQLEGDDIASYDAVTPTVRPGNICQISRKTAIVSRTQDVVNKAGRKREMAYQIEKKSKELKKDMEFALCGKTASVSGADATARVLGGYESWITGGNASRGASGVDGGYNTGTGLTVAPTDGTQRALTEDLLKTILGNIATAGGDPDLIICAPFNKQRISEFTGNNTRMLDGAEGRLETAIDVYISDFGELRVVPAKGKTLRSSGRSALVIQTDMWALSTLDPFNITPLAKTGDAEKRLIIAEYTLEARNAASSGVLADLTTS